MIKKKYFSKNLCFYAIDIASSVNFSCFEFFKNGHWTIISNQMIWWVWPFPKLNLMHDGLRKWGEISAIYCNREGGMQFYCIFFADFNPLCKAKRKILPSRFLISGRRRLQFLRLNWTNFLRRRLTSMLRSFWGQKSMSTQPQPL